VGPDVSGKQPRFYSAEGQLQAFDEWRKARVAEDARQARIIASRLAIHHAPISNWHSFRLAVELPDSGGSSIGLVEKLLRTCERQTVMETEMDKTIGAGLQPDTAVTIVELTEPAYSSLDSEKLARVRSLLRDGAERENQRYLVVDLAAVHFLGASLIGILVGTWRQLVRRKRKLVLCGLTPYCNKLIHTLSLDKLFEIYPTQRMALEEILRCDQDGTGAARQPQICVQKSEVAWDPHLVRLEYVGEDGTPIRSIITQRREAL
jgi:anti-anti-sigma factor